MKPELSEKDVEACEGEVEAPVLRLCHLTRSASYNGYGFSLKSEKGKAGQFIRTVEPGSPADSCGLKKDDRVVEVNGANIGGESHEQVVNRIKRMKNETILLVADPEADEYYKKRLIVIRSDMPNVISLPQDQIEEIGGRRSVIRTISVRSAGDANDQNTISLGNPRLCHLKRWPDYAAGYGFNLHTQKLLDGQYVGKVDQGSPAEAAGLRHGDKILAVNGHLITEDDSHKIVVAKIKDEPNEVKLLVVDSETEKFFKKRRLSSTKNMSGVVLITCPDTQAEAINDTKVTDAGSKEFETQKNFQLGDDIANTDLKNIMLLSGLQSNKENMYKKNKIETGQEDNTVGQAQTKEQQQIDVKFSSSVLEAQRRSHSHGDLKRLAKLEGQLSFTEKSEIFEHL